MQNKSNRIVSVVIVTFGVKDYLNACLDSVKEQTFTQLEIIVIDNSLNPNFNREIKEYHPDIKLYPSPKNLFYCAALNKGIEMSEGDFILCLNDDVTLDKIFIEEALQGFSLNNKIGIVSGKVLRICGKIIDSTGLFLTSWRTAKERGYGIKDKGQFEKGELIFGVNGAVAFYRREMLQEIKEGADYFDSDFRMFYEDLDISWRAKRFGWQAWYNPKAIAYHVRGASFRPAEGLDKPYARRYLDDVLHSDLIKNRYLTIIKNESIHGFIFHLPAIVLYDFVQWVYILFFKPKVVKIFFSNFGYIKNAFQKIKRQGYPSIKANY